jgi:hypothetical protein
MYIKAGNRYINMDNVTYVSDEGSTIVIRFNVINPSTQNPLAIRIQRDEAAEFRDRLTELTYQLPR